MRLVALIGITVAWLAGCCHRGEAPSSSPIGPPTRTDAAPKAPASTSAHRTEPEPSTDASVAASNERSAPHVAIGSGLGNSTSVPADRVEDLRARFLACYETELARDPTVRGSVVLVGMIGPSGELVAVKAPNTPSSALPGDLVECLRLQLSELRFRSPEGGAAVLTVPVSLLPGTPDGSKRSR